MTAEAQPPEGEGSAALAPSVPRFYVNAAKAHGGPYDVTLDFGQRVAAEEIEWQVRISMSWEHLVSMIAAFQRVADEYQTKVGQLPDVDSAVGEQPQAAEISQ